MRQYPLIPTSAFLYFPRDVQIYQYRKQLPHRIIFDGGVAYTSEERNKLNQLHNYIKRQPKNEHIGFMQESTLMRFLQATKYNLDNCLEQLKKYKKWEESILPLTLKPEIQSLLQKGFFYVTGRDTKYRPVIVVNVPKIIDANLKEKTFYEVIGYFFQFVVENCLIQGQVETWITIVDLGKLGMFSLGGTVIDTIKFLSNHFRCRLHRNYLVNCPSSITFLFGMVKKAMTQDQINKIVLAEEGFLPKEAFRQLFEDDIQIQYGGKRANFVEYWPPQVTKRPPNSQQFSRLISVKQYGQKHGKGLLNKTKICQQLLQQYKQIKQKCLAQRTPRQLMLERIQIAINMQKQRIIEENEDCDASDEGDPPQIHLIPQPLLMAELFSFDMMMTKAIQQTK